MDNNTSTGCCSFNNIAWWMTLVVAVLAVPSFGIIAATLIPLKGLGGIVVFVLACWLCTYLGMRLMSNPKIAEQMDFTKK
jgi:hypothetical protein